VRAELQRVRIPVAAAETGGAKGRTLRVMLDRGRVTARVAGAAEQELLVGWREQVAA
jgi:chemotaxis receptor (MCP) glutamine deamidase CheD